MSEMKKIPKIIHYCWFGGKDLPDKEKKCIESWKKILPDYELRLWSEDTFDVNSTQWTRTAYELKKYAFVADYVRIWALNRFGGIYLDTDVKVQKKFDDLLANRFWACFEDVAGSSIATCVIGSEANHPLLCGMLHYYKGAFDMSIVENNIANVVYLTEQLEKYGLKKNGKYQELNYGIKIFPRTYFCPMDYFGNWDISDKTYCIHYFSGSWLPDEEFKKHQRRSSWYFRLLKIMYGHLKKVTFFRKIRERISKL